MDARYGFAAKMAVWMALVGVVVTSISSIQAAGYRTANFEIAAPTPTLAREIGDAAEQFRRELAIDWLGKEMPAWSEPCPIKARVSPRLGAGGATSFLFDRGQVYGWRMSIQGSRERILDSVLPHEVTHTIFATHFRKPLPRWADEGACTTVEHRSEISKQESMLIEFLKTRRALPFSAMMMMKEYPQDVMPLYAQGHSVAHYLIGRRGKRAFLEFLADGMRDENWPRAVREHYDYKNLLTMQNDWLDWVRDGRPKVNPDGAPANVLASATTNELSTRLANVTIRPPRPSPNLIYRANRSDRPKEESAASSSRDRERGPVGMASITPRAAVPPPTSGRERKVILEWSRPPHVLDASVESGTVRR
jgi:hypothetical protein